MTAKKETSELQKEASRHNGRKGGRPRKLLSLSQEGNSKSIPIKHYDKIDPAVLLELSKIGNNLNQLARWCNTYKQGAEAVTVGYWLAKIEEDIKAILPKVVYSEGKDAH